MPARSLVRLKITPSSQPSLANTACTGSYLAFLAPSTDAVFPLLKSAVADTLAFSFLGFFASRLPRRLSPFDIMCPFRTAGRSVGTAAKSGLARLQPEPVCFYCLDSSAAQARASTLLAFSEPGIVAHPASATLSPRL